jgi:hypothetical protein
MHSPSPPQPKPHGSSPRICWQRTTKSPLTKGPMECGTFCRVAPLGIFQEPTSFCLLYDEPCALNAVSLLIDGLACWRNPNSAADGSKLPIVGVNVNYAAQFPNGFGIPGRSVWVHPGVSGLGIIGWKSPITGSVNVAGFFSDLDPNCGNGIIWSVDKGNSTLTRGTIPNGGPPQTF